MMANGYAFTISRVSTVHHDTLVDNFYSGRRHEVKFCLIDDEDGEAGTNSELWEIVFFPMYVDEEELAHGAVAEDSPINGNIVIENGRVTGSSSNYCDLGYRGVQNAVVDYAASYVQKILDKH